VIHPCVHPDEGLALWIATPHIRPDYRGPTERAFTPFGDPANAGPILQRLKAVARMHPQAVAIADGEASLSFAELWQAVLRLGRAIESTQTADRPVGILLPTDRSYIVAVFACLAARRVAVLLDASFPLARNRAIAAATGVGLLITSRSETSAGWPDTVALDPANSFERTNTNSLSDDLVAAFPLDAPAFVLCTSGSSGHPKPIAHSQRTMLHWVRASHDGMHINTSDRVLSLSSLSALGGFVALLSNPLAGAAIQLFDIKLRKITGLLDLLAGEPVTILRAAPSLLRCIVQLPDAKNALAGLRLIQSYGEPLLMSDIHDLRKVLPSDCFIRSTYGSTEASGLTWFAHPLDCQDSVRVPAGTLMPDTEATVLADDGTPCERGVTGELIIRSRYNALGEWVDGRLIAGRLEGDRDDPTRRIYRTGDLARCDADGVFVVVGRKDRMLNVNGQRVEPAEIEAVLRRRPEVREIEVLPAMRHGAAIMIAFIVPNPGAGTDLEAVVRGALRASLPAFMMPSRIFILDAMPRLPGGKVSVQSLYAVAGERAA
jgi:acyl-coenzyme A synthetase/AMP-(fatty) acid ligase